METREIGNSGLKVAPLAFGGNIFGWTVDESQSFRLLDAFTEAGFNLIDTADSYSKWVPGNKGGESETIIGKWLKRSDSRKKVIIATKVGSEMGPGELGCECGMQWPGKGAKPQGEHHHVMSHIDRMKLLYDTMIL